ncbi:MAG TPA: PP2C family protein-serine/threonine phosphatase [Nocardioides sp.]|nr:PP2C family protein-serine/threonine phosphatase [Nocardioides sp.]
MTTAHSVSSRARGVSPRRRLRLMMRRGLTLETRVALALGIACLVITAFVVIFTKDVPITGLMLPLLLASVFLGPRTLPWLVIFVMVMLTVSVAAQDKITTRIAVATVIMFLMGLVVMLTNHQRASLGVGGSMGESMLVDLRDRLLTQARIPDLPGNWSVQSALYSAGGTPFAGDFVVATRPLSSTRLEVTVVDVSGKGEDAGTRALMLSGALGGLIGALRPKEFLPAANDYLFIQDWEEGFATAVHLSLDLVTGAFEIRTAGHPPAVHRQAGSGRWQVLRTEGPILGLIKDAEFTCVSGRLAPGDAVLLYTDGMVEEPRRDIDLGIDRMLGEMESLLRGTWEDAANRLAVSLGSRDDDRAIVVVQRRW